MIEMQNQQLEDAKKRKQERKVQRQKDQDEKLKKALEIIAQRKKDEEAKAAKTVLDGEHKNEEIDKSESDANNDATVDSQLPIDEASVEMDSTTTPSKSPTQTG